MSSFVMGDLNAYSSGGQFVPDGDYAIKDITVKMHQFQTKAGVKKGDESLGAMVTYIDLATKEEKEAFYGFGRKAHQSWAPNPETGKGIMPVPGGPGTPFNNNSKWGVFLKSLYDSGLPNGVFTDDVSVLEGTWVHVQNVPEPADWGKIGAATGEAAEERKAGTIAVVTEIKDDGKPWEGTGGVPEAEEEKPKPTLVKGKPPVKPAVAAKPKPMPAPAPAAEEEEGDDTADALALSQAADLLAKKASGCPKIMLRTHIFSKVKEKYGDGPANTVVKTHFKNDQTLNDLVEGLGFKVVGPDIKPAE